MNNVVNITFLEDATSPKSISVTTQNTDLGSSFIRIMLFQFTPRLNSGQIQVYDPSSGGPSPYTNIEGEYTAALFLQYYLLDYGFNGLVTGSRNGNTVTLVLNSTTNIFLGVGGSLDTRHTYDTQINDFELTNLNVFADEENPCTFCTVRFTMSNNIKIIKRDGITIANNHNSNLYDALIFRGNTTDNFYFEDYNGNTYNSGQFGIYSLNGVNISVSIIQGQTGSTVYLDYNFPVNPNIEPLELEWSLDGENFFEENILTGQEDGSYTVYVRDQFGCIKSKSFSIQSGELRTPTHFISEANSIDYILQENVDNCSVFRNYENSFNHQDLNNKKYCDNILFNLCDKIKTQLKTNYSNVSVKLRKEQYFPGSPGTPDIPANSNLLLYSEQAENNVWIIDDVIIDVDADGVAEKIKATSFNSLHNITQVVSKEEQELDYTASVFVKPDEYSRVYIRLADENLNGGVAGWMNLNTGVWTQQIAFGGWNELSTSISSVDENGYYRVSLTVNSDNSNNIQVSFGLVNDNNEFGFIGDNNSGMFFKNMQLHQGDLNLYIQTTDEQIFTELIPGEPALPESDMTTYDLFVLQQSTNLNRFLSLDGVAYSYSDGLTGIYFESGNIYDEEGSVIDEHALNGNKPDFAKVGNIININGLGSFIIQQIVYDENVLKNVLIIQNNFVSSPQQVIVSSTFDLLNFEVFEFEIDWEEYGEGLYDVVIELTDENYENVCYISENILIKQNHEDTVCIIYYNENNRDIFYKYGIKHLIRIPLLEVQYDVKDNFENNVGDFSSELILSNFAKKDNYIFTELPAKRRFTLLLALGFENLFINGLGYIKESNATLEHITNTNLAKVNQELVRTNINYNIDNQNNVPLDDATLFDIPTLINNSNKLIKKK